MVWWHECQREHSVLTEYDDDLVHYAADLPVSVFQERIYQTPAFQRLVAIIS